MAKTARTGLAVSAGATLAALVSACGGAPPSAANGMPAGPITVTASDSACQVSATTAPAGNLTFQIANHGTKVTEFYLYGDGDGDRIMGEVENIAPGLTRRLIVEVADGGTYQTACKPEMAGAGIRSPFTVTGGAAKGTDANAQLAEAARGYARYVSSQTGAFADETRKFATAIKAKDVAAAKSQYARTRIYYERIEPVAAKFGDLDPAIDVREADVQPGQKFTGFHRLEKDLWVTGLQPDSAAIADRLVADVTTLGQKASALQLSALDLANGAESLLDEVARGKITGEEEAFSHTDLSDFQANVDGSKGAIQALRPVLAQRNPALVSTLDARFAAVQTLLDAQRTGDTFKLYTDLTQSQIKKFAAAVDALSEPLSKVAEVVAH
ncbi:iron uptake system protein EfeO [Amycolatopsis sp. NPDC023774]|uniref:iron uptake system protein EfeO n=1 Tax=Amycolatopsis sp. NPDC023774 TaxID=3155015 RepID=UPI00340BF3F5